MKHLFICRHGQSEFNVKFLYSGQTDTPLTDLGRSQAKTAAEQVTALNIDLIVASPSIRALETAQIIASEINYPVDTIITNPLFLERSYGSLEGKSYAIPLDSKAYPDIETEASIFVRAQQALKFLQSLEANNILVVGHGTFAIAMRVVLDPNASLEELPNAEIVQLM